MKQKEIQISVEVETSALKQFYSDISSGSYHPVINAAKSLAERFETLLLAHAILHKAFLNDNGITDHENHIVLLGAKEIQIIEIEQSN